MDIIITNVGELHFHPSGDVTAFILIGCVVVVGILVGRYMLKYLDGDAN